MIEATRGTGGINGNNAHGADVGLQDLVVLYAEDDPTVREQFSRFLSRRARKVHTVENGALGLAAFERYKPDLVITDILMPVMDGLSMTEKIKARNPNTPVVVTTAHSEANRLLRAIEVGVDQYVIKPIDFDALRAALSRCARAVHADRERRIAGAVMDATSEAIAVIDGDGLIVSVNPAFLRIGGWHKPLSRRDIVSVLSPDDPRQEWAQHRARGQSWHGEAMFRRADGTAFPAIAALDVIAEFAGNVSWSVLAFADVRTLAGRLLPLGFGASCALA